MLQYADDEVQKLALQCLSSWISNATIATEYLYVNKNINSFAKLDPRKKYTFRSYRDSLRRAHHTLERQKTTSDGKDCIGNDAACLVWRVFPE